MLRATRVHLGGFVDGELTAWSAERAAVCSVIRRVRPDIVLTHDPWKRYRLHPDHRNAGFLVLDSVVAARDIQFFPEIDLAPHRPEQILLFEAEVIDHWERVDDYFDTKVGALMAHHSQWRSTMGIDEFGADAEAQRDAFSARLHAEVIAFGAQIGGGAAEGFKRIAEV